VAPLQIAAGAVIVAFGTALTLTVALAVPLQLLLFVTVTPRVTGPETDVNVIAFVPLPEVIVPFVIVQAYVAPEIAAVEALPLAPAQIADGAVIDGAGLLLTVTGTSLECALQPLEFVTVTENVPVALTLIDCVVLPSLHAYCDIPAGAESVTLPPWQKVVGPFAVMVVSGRALTLTVALAVPLQLLLFVTVTPRVTGPDADVNVIAFVPLPEVIEPFVIVHA
jgi:hypothetical protein